MSGTPKSPARVFLDTSVLIAAALSTTGPAHAICLLARQGQLQAVVSESVVLEFRDVVRRKFAKQESRFAELLQFLGPEVAPAPTAKDMQSWKGQIEEGDWHVLASATSAGGSYLVTHDVKDFKTKALTLRTTFKLMTPGEFLVQWSLGGM